MNPEPTRTIIQAVKDGERKQAPLIEALSATPITLANIAEVVNAFNELDGAFGAELISRAWVKLDDECRRHVMREWVDKKDKEQQAGAFHALAAKLLTLDANTSLDLLDRVHKLASAAPVCRRRVLQVTKVEWIATTPQKSRLRAIDLGTLDTPGRSLLVDWIVDACAAEIKPSDSDKRKDELQRESASRTSIVKTWISSIQNGPLPDMAKRALERNSIKLGLKAEARADAARVSAPTDITGQLHANGTNSKEREQPRTESQTSHTSPIATRPEARTESPKVPERSPAASSRIVIEEENDVLREAFLTIQQVIRKNINLHAREKKEMSTEVESLRIAAKRSENELTQLRASNQALIEQVSTLEDRLATSQASESKTAEALAEATTQLQAANAGLELERKEKQSIRMESHDAVDRETQRERERLLTQIGQRLGNIVEGYQEIRSRGPLPEGTPAMVGEMMDELISTLVAAGVKVSGK